MIAKKNRSIRYLTRQDIAEIHADLSEQVLSDGSEPLPDFRYGKQEAIDALIAAPQQRFYGRDAYPTPRRKSGDTSSTWSIGGTYSPMGISGYPLCAC